MQGRLVTFRNTFSINFYPTYFHDTYLILVPYPLPASPFSPPSSPSLSSPFFPGHSEIVRYCIEEGCDVNWVNESGWSGLHLACKWGNVPSVEYLIEAGGDLLCVDKEGNTCLHHACVENSVEMMYYLLVVRGMDFTLLNNAGQTPRQYAISKELEDIVDDREWTLWLRESNTRYLEQLTFTLNCAAKVMGGEEGEDTFLTSFLNKVTDADIMLGNIMTSFLLK